MEKKPLWTQLKARLTPLQRNDKKNLNWLFLPGGPGLGSESLNPLTQMLQLPGSMWNLDLPDDGSNIAIDHDRTFSNWQAALIEACEALENVILVAHSTGGMFALATAALEKNLVGLVLMDSAPNASWQQYFMNYVLSHQVAHVETLQKQYQLNPSNDLLKTMTMASVPYFSTKQSEKKMLTMLDSLPFNYRSQLWADQHFDQTYKAEWVPETIPTLIFAGEYDHITPLKLFMEAKEFHRKNILFREINNAAHFPWMDNPAEVKQLFNAYVQLLATL